MHDNKIGLVNNDVVSDLVVLQGSNLRLLGVVRLRRAPQWGRRKQCHRTSGAVLDRIRFTLAEYLMQVLPGMNLLLGHSTRDRVLHDLTHTTLHLCKAIRYTYSRSSVLLAHRNPLGMLIAHLSGATYHASWFARA